MEEPGPQGEFCLGWALEAVGREPAQLMQAFFPFFYLAGLVHTVVTVFTEEEASGSLFSCQKVEMVL